MGCSSLKGVLAAGTALWAIHAAPAFAQAQTGPTSPTAPGAAAATPGGTVTASPGGAAAVPPRAAAATSTVGEVIVTARRTEERLQDVPISITVFNQQQLANRNITQAVDLATYTPSLSASSFFGSTNTSFNIRGFNQQYGTAPTVGVYFADVIAPRAASNNIPVGDGAGPGNFFDLQNVQVLKGPQGTLFGLNTTGGAVLLVPQKPTSRYEGYVEASYGDYDMKRLQAVVNIPFADNVRFRVGVDHQSRNGYLDNTTGIGASHFDDVDYTAVRGSLDVDVAPNVENYTIFSYLVSQTNGDLQKTFNVDPNQLLGAIEQTSLNLNPANKGFYSAQSIEQDPYTRERQWQIIDTASWHATDHLLVKDIISYAQLKENISSALFGSDLDLHNFSALSGVYPANFALIGISNIYPVPGGNTADQSTFTNEFQVQGDALDGGLTYQGGIYYERSDPIGLAGSQSENLDFCTSLSSINCANPFVSGSTSVNYGKTRYSDVGVYVQSTYTITPKLKLTGGFRYTSDKTSTSGNQYVYNYNSPLGLNPLLGLFPNPPIGSNCINPDTAPSCVVAYKESSSAPTGLVDLDYKPIEDLLLYAKYSRGYREGGLSPGVPTEFAIYQPEHLNAYETGLKATLRGPVRGTIDVAGFYNDFSNEQVQAVFYPTVSGSTAEQSGTVNATSSRSYGVEFEGSITPFAGFTVDVGYSYIDAKILSIPTLATPANSLFYVQSGPINGDPEEFTPKNHLTVTATYELPLSPDIGHITVGGDYTFIGGQNTNYVVRNPPITGALTGDSLLPSRNLLDFSLNWRSIFRRPVDMSLFVTNATNEEYYTEYTGIIAAGFDTAAVGPPRMYGVRLRYHFGS